jgi:hypothetical protein
MMTNLAKLYDMIITTGKGVFLGGPKLPKIRPTCRK